MSQASDYWTVERTERAIDCWESGKSAGYIARLLGDGITRNAVQGKLFRMGYKREEGQRRARPTIPNPRPKAVMPKPRPVVVDTPITIDGERITLAVLADGMCKFPIGDPLEPGFHFCGNLAKEGSPYCNGHHKLCYRPYDGKKKDPAVRDWNVDHHKRFDY